MYTHPSYAADPKLNSIQSHMTIYGHEGIMLEISVSSHDYNFSKNLFAMFYFVPLMLLPLLLFPI